MPDPPISPGDLVCARESLETLSMGISGRWYRVLDDGTLAPLGRLLCWYLDAEALAEGLLEKFLEKVGKIL
jgi:hypothetical protein